MKQNGSNGWHKFPDEMPKIHQRCLVLYKLLSTDGKRLFPACTFTEFFPFDVHDNVWRLYENAPPIIYWKPMNELPNDMQYE